MRYLKEKNWAGRDLPHVADGDLVHTLLRVLRGTPRSNVTASTIKDIDLEPKRDMRFPGTPAYAAGQERLKNLWRMVVDVGVGHLYVYVRKYKRKMLSSRTIEWLRQNRVPGYMPW